MPEVFMGIIEGPLPGTVTLGLIDEENDRVSGSTFPVAKMHLNNYHPAPRDSDDTIQLPSDLFEIGKFLDENIPNDSKVHVLAEVPELLVDPASAETWEGIPYAVLPIDSVMLRIVILLAELGYVAVKLTPSVETARTVLFPLLTQAEFAHYPAIVPKYLRNGICKAYGELLFGQCDRPEDAAIVGALIAKNPGAYHYWSSIGQVQSSQDVMFYLGRGQVEPTSVISAQESYTIEVSNVTVRDEIEDLPLEYVLAERRYAHLGPNDAIKAALIHVCKRWRIVLRCASWRDDADGPRASYLVQPLGESASIVTAALEPVKPPKPGLGAW